MIFTFLSADAVPTLGEAGLKALIMIVVVFAALCVLSLIIWLFGRIGGSEKKAEKPAAVPTPAPAPVSAAAEDDGEVVAAIAAAVTMMQPDGVTYQVKKITPAKRSGGSRPIRQRSEWAAAAVHQNTSPF